MAQPSSDDQLSEKQRRFCEEYLIDLNATQAAIRAGYAPRAARAQAARLLTKDNIQAHVSNLRAAQAKRLEIDADVVLRELLMLARSDIADFFDDAGQMKQLSDIPEHARRAVASLEVEELYGGSGPDRAQIGWTKKLKLWSKPQALELLGKHLKLWIERHEHTGKDGAPLLVGAVAMTDADLERIASGRGA